MSRLTGVLIWIATAIMGAATALVVIKYTADWGISGILPTIGATFFALAVGAFIYSLVMPDHYE